MSSFLIGPHANLHIDEIYDYMVRTWGLDQADRYVETLFEYFTEVAANTTRWRDVPAEFEIGGYFGKCERDFVYWKVLTPTRIGIVAILHERMHQIEQIQGLFSEEF